MRGRKGTLGGMKGEGKKKCKDREGGLERKEREGRERELEEGSKEGGEGRGKGATGGKERGRRMVWLSTEVLFTL